MHGHWALFRSGSMQQQVPGPSSAWVGLAAKVLCDNLRDGAAGLLHLSQVNR